MLAYEAGVVHRFNTFLRFYVSKSPEAAETAWQASQQFDRLSDEQKEPGHWYRYEGGLGGVIEVRADRSGQWHADGIVPAEVDPKLVVNIPVGEAAPTLLEHMTVIMNEIPENDANHAAAMSILAGVKGLGDPQRPAKLAKGFQQALAEVPAVAEQQLQFLQQAWRQVLEQDLVAGKVTGDDAAGVLMVAAIANAVATANPAGCAVLLTKAAGWDVVAIDEMAARMMDLCWQVGLKAQLSTAFDAMRSVAEKTIQNAREGKYPEGHPEMVLDVYYGMLLQAIPYLTGTNNGYFKLSKAPQLSPEDLAGYAHKANTSEEKLVRLMTAVQYAVKDVDLSQLADKQARVAAVLKTGDKDRADSLVREIVDLEFFYPVPFRSVLLGVAVR